MSQDRKTLIRVASGMPAGDPARRAILAALQRQSDFIREHTKRIPGWVKKRLPEFIRVLDQVDLVDRQRAGSKNPSDAFSDVLKLLEHGGFERDYPRSYEKQIMRVEEKLRNDWLDEVGDDEDFPTDPFKWSMKVWEELGRQLVKAGILGKRAKKAGILGKRAKKTALRKRAVWGWVSMAIDELLKARHLMDGAPPGTWTSLFKSLDKRERARVPKTNHRAWVKGMTPLIASTHGAEERWVKSGLEDMLFEDLFELGMESQMDNWSGNRDWNDEDEQDLLNEFFNTVAKL